MPKNPAFAVVRASRIAVVLILAASLCGFLPHVSVSAEQDRTAARVTGSADVRVRPGSQDVHVLGLGMPQVSHPSGDGPKMEPSGRVVPLGARNERQGEPTGGGAKRPKAALGTRHESFSTDPNAVDYSSDGSPPVPRPRWAGLGVGDASPPIIKSSPKLTNVGLQLYTVRDDCAKDFPGTLKAVAKMGFSGVEFAGYFGHTAQELRKMLDEDHLQCFGSHIQLDDLLGDNFDKTVEFNKTLGNKLVVVPWIPVERRNTRAALLQTCKLFNELAKKLEARGLMLGYHNHQDEFKPVDGELFWDTFFNNTDARVKIQFDIGNALAGGAQAAPFLRKFPNRLISVHVKDFSKSNPTALLGEGDENWNEVLPILKNRPAPRWLIIEQETYPLPPLACAEKCLRNFEAMMARK